MFEESFKFLNNLNSFLAESHNSDEFLVNFYYVSLLG